MKNFATFLVIGSLFLAVFGGFGYYLMHTNKEDYKVQELNTISKNSLVSNLDYSSRITEGVSYFDQETFETRVRSELKNTFKEGVTVKFTYLNEFNNTIKSVRVQVKEGSNTYQTTLLTNVNGGELKK